MAQADEQQEVEVRSWCPGRDQQHAFSVMLRILTVLACDAFS